VSAVERTLDKADWMDAAFGAAATALFGLTTYIVAGDAFIGMSLSLGAMLFASALQNHRGEA